MSTGISCCDKTWNIVGGCTRCSPACDSCWALRVSHRQDHNPGVGATYRGLTTGDPKAGTLDWTGEVRCRPELLEQPLHWKKPRVVLVASMSDLFHPDVSLSFITKALTTMLNASQHIYLLLTKRPARMLNFVRQIICAPQAYDHIYFGVSAWDVESLYVAAFHLRHMPVVRRWISYEPALGAVSIEHMRAHLEDGRINWLVWGVESGPGRCVNSIQWDWADAAREACALARVPFYLKQLADDYGKVITAPALDGSQYLETPWGK